MNVSLDDKYLKEGGQAFLSSVQALTRVLLEQSRRDREAGLNTAGFVSGYRGSPIGSLDSTLLSASQHLEAERIKFLPGLNEELAATVVRGTQQLEWFGDADVEGQFAMWYGKGLGADRAGEAIKLGNLEGASPKGGVLIVVGDDHGGKSSVSSHQSEHLFVAGMLPIIYPSTTQEILEYGLFGYQLSRYSGLYVAMKCVTDTLDLSATATLPTNSSYRIPDDVAIPEGGLNLRPEMSQLFQEDLTVNHRLPAAQAFVRANGLDRVVFDAPDPKLVIVSAGKAYLDTRQALADLGLSEEKCRRLGIRVYKPGLVWPLEPSATVAATGDAKEVLVVEEKRPLIEDQLAKLLYGHPNTPHVVGKRDDQGAALLSTVGELNPTLVRNALMNRLIALELADEDIQQRFAGFESAEQRALNIGGGTLIRPPYFCSGCPHNRSTRVPDGSNAMGATGCHGMPAYQPGSRTMRPMSMGAEGMPWLGVSHLVHEPHRFQNLGDGTYSHSGVLAIRAAVAAKVRMTYKILFNDAVAMTGGQPVEVGDDPAVIAAQLVAEGVKPVVVVYDPAEAFDPKTLPQEVAAYERDELDRVQKELRETDGVSALIYVQTCAAEKRRRRKRNEFFNPDQRVFINSAVCEGCGDCSVQSNCISIQPKETEFGRKRVIDQSSCNKDFSCVKGFCPSFVTVRGGSLAKVDATTSDSLASAIDALPEPEVAALEDESYNVLVTGVGGTGVLTVSALVGMAAHIDGLACSVMDMTGMAQKGGAVTSHLRLARDSGVIHNARFDTAMVDALIGCDLIVAAGADVLKTLKANRTQAVLNSNVASTGDFATNPLLDLDPTHMTSLVSNTLGENEPWSYAATRLAVQLTGDSIATNVLMLGMAAQKGLLPVSVAAIEEAIRLNGKAVDMNLRVFGCGRLAAHDDTAFSDVALQTDSSGVDLSDLQSLIEHHEVLLTTYQNPAYAQQFSEFVNDVAARVSGIESSERDEFLRAVVVTLSKLMRYKDEYEVARLFSDGAFWQDLSRQFAGDYKISFNLAPPLLSRRIDSATGRPKKIELGAWMKVGFRLLERFKFLRGTLFDPFGYGAERRMEQSLIREYRELILKIIGKLDVSNIEIGIEIASAAQSVKGYGVVKEEAKKTYDDQIPQLVGQLDTVHTFIPHKELVA